MGCNDGIDCLKIIRSSINYKDVRVVMYSGHSVEWMKQLCLSSGVDYYITKTGSLESLSKALQPFFEVKKDNIL